MFWKLKTEEKHLHLVILPSTISSRTEISQRNWSKIKGTTSLLPIYHH